MARRKRTIGTVSPIITVGAGPGALGPGSPAVTQRSIPSLAPDGVWIGSDDPPIDFIARLNGKPTALPQPQYDRRQRPGAFSLNRYAGHDLYEMPVPLLLDRGGASVDTDFRTLERLGERTKRTLEPPIVQIWGIGVPHTGLKWRVTFPNDPDIVRYNTAGQLVQMAISIRLVQHVTDDLLTETIGPGKGFKTGRHVTGKKGETLHDVARRVYGDPSRASDLARANPGRRLGERFRTDVRLQVP